MYLLSFGLAAAKIAVLAFNEHTTPYLAIDIVCYSITSCKIDYVPSSILSNSSIQHIPWSDNTRAPDSKIVSPVYGSFLI